MNRDKERKQSTNAKSRAAKSATQMWVSTNIRIPLETLELLRDVSLARSFAELSTETTRNNEVTTKKEVSLSSVITELIEKNRAALEHDAEMVRGGHKGTSKNPCPKP